MPARLPKYEIKSPYFGGFFYFIKGEYGMEDLLVQLYDKHRVTFEHCLRVGKLAKFLTSHLTGVDEVEKRNFIKGCCVHDIGKLMTPNQILNKPATLTPDDWQILKRHPETGVSLFTKGDVDKQVIDIVKFHHERWDGFGYPHGLKANEIPVFARICSIIDAFDSMISDRPYRKGLPIENAKEELHNQSWSQFDGLYVNEFLSLPDHLLTPVEPKELPEINIRIGEFCER
jgi:putative nucleotidyltransferase with HDIG domain